MGAAGADGKCSAAASNARYGQLRVRTIATSALIMKFASALWMDDYEKMEKLFMATSLLVASVKCA